MCNEFIRKKKRIKGAIATDEESLNREGNGTPLQHSCLENPKDGGAW